MHSSAHHYGSQSRSSVFTKELTTLGLYEQHYSVVLYRSLEESFFYHFLVNETVSIYSHTRISASQFTEMNVM